MIKRKILPSQAYLHECFYYNTDNGLLYWKERPLHHFTDKNKQHIFNKNYTGSIAKTRDSKSGYLYVTLFGKSYPQHRIIYKMIEGVEPKHIDHINRKRNDNRAFNLRSVTHSENMLNRGDKPIEGIGLCSMKARRVAQEFNNTKQPTFYTEINDSIKGIMLDKATVQ